MNKRRKIAETVAKTILCCSILISCFYSSHPAIVMLSSFIALTSLLSLKFITSYRRHDLTMLKIAESTERSFLIQVKKRVKNGTPFNDELMNLCDTATSEAEAKFKMIHGFNRTIQ